MSAKKPLASLSLDLDNLWSYLKTHGEPAWQKLPTYLPLVTPRILSFLQERGLTITFFVVGQDADRPENAAALRAIAAAGHEIGNHSYRHEPWLHRRSETEIHAELRQAEEAIERATGCRPAGFRGPGFSFSPATLRVLIERGYTYDASTFPTFLGPLARLYYFMSARLTVRQKRERRSLFGTFSEGFRSNRPYRWQTELGSLLEIPVTTLPFLRTPIHASYLLYLSLYSPFLARAYLHLALLACRLTNTTPSFLLHPLDFMGCDDAQELAFFPAMKVPSTRKLGWLSDLLALLTREFKVGTMGEHAATLESLPQLRSASTSLGTVGIEEAVAL